MRNSHTHVSDCGLGTGKLNLNFMMPGHYLDPLRPLSVYGQPCCGPADPTVPSKSLSRLNDLATAVIPLNAVLP